MILFYFLSFTTAKAKEVPCDHTELSTKNKKELRLLRNTIFATYGRPFRSNDLKEHFSKQSWYKENTQYSDSMLSSIDKECVERVLLWEKGKPKQTLQVDLEGKGTLDNVYLFDYRPKVSKASDAEELCKPNTCFVTIGFQNYNVRIDVPWKQNSWTVRSEQLGSLDIFARYREDYERHRSLNPDYEHLPTHIYFKYAQSGFEDPPANFHLLSLYKGNIYSNLLIGNRGPKMFPTGFGHVRFLKGHGCPITYTEWYIWRDGPLIQFRTEEQFNIGMGSFVLDTSPNSLNTGCDP